MLVDDSTRIHVLEALLIVEMRHYLKSAPPTVVAGVQKGQCTTWCGRSFLWM